MKRYVVIVAGGKGSRMNAGIPKQFILLGGKPVLMHTILRFHEADPSTEIIVVLPGNEINAWKELCNRYSFTIVHKIAEGGDSRFQSVKNGLALVKEKSIVAIHDGARPFASVALINRCFSSAEEFVNAVPSIPVNESLREVKGKQNKTADSNLYVVIQTPRWA